MDQIPFFWLASKFDYVHVLCNIKPKIYILDINNRYCSFVAYLHMLVSSVCRRSIGGNNNINNCYLLFPICIEIHKIHEVTIRTAR